MHRSFDNFRMGANGVDPDRDAQQLDRSADYGYVDRDRYFDDRERYRRGLEHSDAWRHEGEEEERARYHQGMSHIPDTAAHQPYPASHMTSDAWRGRNEDYDVWGRERRAAYHAGHPSLWQRVKGAFSGKGPKNYVRSDERIHEDVCEALTHHPYVDASDIEVTVRDGEVTLTGTVDARMVKRAAEDACDHVRGVQDVHNHLRVRRPEQQEPSPSPGTRP